MKSRLALVTAIVTLVAAVGTGLITAAPAGAQPLGLTVPCVDNGAPIANCTLEVIGFNNQGGTLSAVFRLTNEATGQVTRFVVPILGIGQQIGSCTILDLQTGPIDLFLLGLDLHIDPIHIILEAQRGTLLGDLLCGIFFGDPVAGLLNELLRLNAA